MASVTHLKSKMTMLRLNINHQSEVYQGWLDDCIMMQGARQILESSRGKKKIFVISGHFIPQHVIVCTMIACAKFINCVSEMSLTMHNVLRSK